MNNLLRGNCGPRILVSLLRNITDLVEQQKKELIFSLLTYVFKVASTRQKLTKKQSLSIISEYFEEIFGTAMAAQLAKQRSIRASIGGGKYATTA